MAGPALPPFNSKNKRLSKMKTLGTISKLVAERGFCFAKTDSGSVVFIHASECDGRSDDLALGMRVRFGCETTDRGTKGVNIELCDDPVADDDGLKRVVFGGQA